MHSIPSRLPDIGTSIFTVMSKMALEEGAINLSQGFPDFDVDKKIIDLIYQHMQAGRNQYAPMPGVPVLCEVIADTIKKTYRRNVNPATEITITAGATEAIFSGIASVISQGDEVILFDPSYDSYNPAIRLNGGIPVHTISLNESTVLRSNHYRAVVRISRWYPTAIFPINLISPWPKSLHENSR